jgi:hypothetical protein
MFLAEYIKNSAGVPLCDHSVEGHALLHMRDNKGVKVAWQCTSCSANTSHICLKAFQNPQEERIGTRKGNPFSRSARGINTRGRKTMPNNNRKNKQRNLKENLQFNSRFDLFKKK